MPDLSLIPAAKILPDGTQKYIGFADARQIAANDNLVVFDEQAAAALDAEAAVEKAAEQAAEDAAKIDAQSGDGAKTSQVRKQPAKK